MARCSIWPPALKAMATPARAGSGAANGPSTRKRKDRTTRQETPMTDTSRFSCQLLMVGPGIDRITPEIHDKLASLLDLLPATATINGHTDAGYFTVPRDWSNHRRQTADSLADQTVAAPAIAQNGRQ